MSGVNVKVVAHKNLEDNGKASEWTVGIVWIEFVLYIRVFEVEV